MSDSNGKLNGHGGHHDDEGNESDDDATALLGDVDDVLTADEIASPPFAVAELVASCVRFVTSKYKVPLDFTEETLSLLDQYVRDARAEILVRPEAVDIVAASAGAYLGELIRQRFGGYWYAEGDYSGWRVMLSRVYLAFNPIGMVREAVLLEDQEGWHAHFETDPGEREIVTARLESLPEVSEDEYFAPTTRFDVVQVTVNALRAYMQQNSTSDVRFTREDYG